MYPMTIKQCIALLVSTLLSSAVLAAGHHAGAKKLGAYSGFEGNEAALGAAVAEAILETSPTKDADHDFTDQERAGQMGLAVSTAIKTLNHNTAYHHEMNDALVKMTLSHIQFAKDHDLLDTVAADDAQNQFPMLRRVAKLIEKTGNPELALVAITDQTTCFFQLVEEVEKSPGSVTWKSPYGNVLAQTTRMGMHDLTEEEIHEIWTKPRIAIWSEVMGVPIEVSEWNEDGIVTISLAEEQVAAN